MLARLGARADELMPDRPGGSPQARERGGREPRPLSARYAWVYLAIGIIPAVIYFLPHGPLGHHALYDGIGLLCVAGSVFGVRRNRPPNAIAWYLFALGQFAFVSGDLIRAYYEVVVGGSAPFPGFADVAY